MRLLADENFPKPVVETLRAAGHDFLGARTDLAGAKDVSLLDLAESEARIVLTLDKNLWQIAVPRRNPREPSRVVSQVSVQRNGCCGRRFLLFSVERQARVALA